MTGGVIYQRLQPEMGLTKEAISRRMAIGAKVSIQTLNKQGKEDINELLTQYISLLKEHNQAAEASLLEALLPNLSEHFVQIVPIKEQADPSISTE